MVPRLAQARAGVLLSLALATSGCTWAGRQIFGAPPPGQPGHVAGFYGAVAADEPRAALTGRDVLSGGGNAADAAAAVGFTLAVTLPSRASLGSGGGCLVYRPGRGEPEAVMFTPTAPAAAGERPAAVPMLALGLGTLHARYGRQPLANLLIPAQQLARFGVPVSRTLARDIAVVGMPLLGDPAMRQVFAPTGGSPLGEGASMTQADLGATLAQLRDAGVEDLYRGSLGRRLEDAARQAGAGLTLADLAGARVGIAPPITVADGRDTIAFLPPPADGGLAAAAAFRVLLGDRAALGPAQARAIAAAARWRAGGVTADTLLAGELPPANLPALPASTSFVTLDRNGMAVACALTMDNLFGIGRIAPGTGILLAASPAAVPPPLLAAAIAWNPHRPGFRAAVGGSGQEAAAVAVADGLIQALRPARPKAPPVPRPVPEPGRINVISCAGYVPGDEDTCRWAPDRRSTGAAYGGSEE
ncbi:MAG: gamma-glutamyltransferase [Alphaproteobacteria bacterium]|nr:gamma-glutamyltransferase [Alphaproteobacteria bacterium]